MSETTFSVLIASKQGRHDADVVMDYQSDQAQKQMAELMVLDLAWDAWLCREILRLKSQASPM